MNAQTDFFKPYKETSLRLPSVPLIANDPYISFWSPYDKLTDGTTRHWDGQVKAMDGLLRVDGKVYRFMGAKRDVKLQAIAPMANKGRWVAKVKYTNPGDNWFSKTLNDASWPNGYGAFGGSRDFENIYTNWTGDNKDVYIRRHVTLTEADLNDDLWIVYSHDDKCEMYINGVQIVSTPVEWHENVKVQIKGEAKGSLVAGDNVIAFHVHNTNGGSHADVGLYRNAMGRHSGMTAIAAMSDGGAWDAKVSRSFVSGWFNDSFNDSKWATETGAFGTPTEYPFINTSWTASNSDVYIRRHITLTAEDLTKPLCLIYSHDDVCQAYINGRKLASTGETWVQNVKYFLTDEDKAVLREGDNVIAYHVHNTTGGALADIGLYSSENEEYIAVQKKCHVLATNTYYTFQCGPVDLSLVFTAPMLMDELDLMSTPINYISYKVASNDGQPHDVQFFFGTTPELTVNNNLQTTTSSVIEVDGHKYVKAGSKTQPILGKAGDHITIDWGYLYISDQNGSVTVGDQEQVNTTFTTTGTLPAPVKLDSSEDSDMPALAYVSNLGSITEASSYMMVGYDEVKDIRYIDVDYKGYWARNGKTITQAFTELAERYDEIMERCQAMDKVIYDDGLEAGNRQYAELLSGSYKQTIAAHKIFQDNKGNLLFFSKENDSNGCVNTVDLTYPSAPLFLIYNTDLEKGMCTSILDYCQSDRWGFDFAAHDLGTYPHANNQVYSIRFPDSNGGFAGNMPIEESANIVILAACISLIDGNLDWAGRYWKTLKTWSDYLAANGLDPENQLCTDDFAGHLAHNANLSVKAIMGVAGFGLLCKLKGDMVGYEHYMDKAKEMADSWVTMAKDGTHYKLAFDRSGTWSQKYNMVWDKMWGTELFPATVYSQEMKYYMTKQNTYGVPLDSRESYSKTDWVAWTATLGNKTQFLNMMNPLYNYVNKTNSRVPLSDWYWTISGDMRGFRARSVIGGHWMKVLMDKYMSGAFTGINDVQSSTPQPSANQDWYSISGQKLGQEPTSPGIYIHGGKKVSVK